MTYYVVKFTDSWGDTLYIQHGKKGAKNPINAKLYETYEEASEIVDCCHKAACGEIKPYNLELKHQKPGLVTKDVPHDAADARVCKVTFEIEEM